MPATTHPHYGYWTGGYYVMAMKEWHWLDMTRVSGYTHWGPGQPVAQTYMYDHPIAMVNPYAFPTYKGWTWQDLAIGTAMGFICETSSL